MPDFETKPWSTIAAFVVDDVLPALLIVIAALIALRLARLFVHGIVKTLLDREATEGTAQELSAVELKKRMDTLDSLATNILQFFIVIIAGVDGPRPARARHRAGHRGSRRGRHRGRLRGAVPRPRLPQRRADPDREPVRPGRRRPHRRRRRDGRGLHPAADDAARPRRRRPHGPQRRDPGRLQPDPRLVAHQPGRHGRLRHRHRQGHRGRRRGRRARWPAIRSGSGGSSRRRASSGSATWASTASPSRSSGTVRAADQWAAGGDFRRRLLEAFKANGIEIAAAAAATSLVSRRPGTAGSTAAGTGPGRPRRGNGVGEPARRGRPSGRRDATVRGRMARPVDRRKARASVSVEPSLPSPEIENLHGRVADLPAGSRRSPPRPTRRPTSTTRPRRDFEAFWAKRARERIDWSKPFETTLEWDLPFAKWFIGGELNVAYNCVDRHVERGLGDKVAYHWIGEPGDTRTLTFRDLQREVSKAANALKELGVADRRPGRHLHADDPGAADRDARLRPDRRAAHGRLRWLLGRGAVGPDQRLRREGPDHRRRRLPARQGGRRSRTTPTRRSPRRRRSRRRSSSSGPATTSTWSTAATTGGTTSSTASPRTARRSRSSPSTCSTCSTPRARPPSPRASCTRPAGYLARHVVQPRGDLRHQARRRVLVRRRHRLGDRPQLHRLRPARQRDDRGPVRGRARTRPAGTAGGRSSRTTRSPSCTAPRRRSARS